MDVAVPVVVFRGKAPVALLTSDVSFKGLFVRTDDPPALRSLVRLRVALFDREFDAHAMAVHVVPADGATGDARVAGVGLQFWGLSGQDRAAWDQFVRGLVHARRATAKKAAAQAPPSEGHREPPPLLQPATPSGVRIVVSPSRSSTK